MIEDSEDELSQGAERNRHAADGVIDSSPGEDAGAIDAEFDLLFGSTTRSKRKRISLDIDGDAEPGDTDTPSAQRGKPPFGSEPILSSSPEPSWPQAQGTSPVRPRREEYVRHTGPNTSITDTPKQPTPSASTPRTTKPTKETPFRPQPRFKLSATQVPSNTQSQSQSQSQINPTPTRDPSPTRRKRGFILPRSPSPSETREEDPTIPTPFSPSSHALYRRGRRSRAGNAQGYLPGGMADEVRRWVLEMGAKREHHHFPHQQQQQQRQRLVEDSSFSGIDTRGYLLVGRVQKVRRDVVGSSGPVTFVLVEECERNSGDDQTGEVRSLRNILLFGMPRSKPERSSTGNDVPDLQQGRLVGVHKGLVWEIELDKRSSETKSSHESHGDPEKWLVCMEWDIIQ